MPFAKTSREAVEDMMRTDAAARRETNETATLTLEAVRLALASVFDKGHETRAHVELAAAVVGEVYGLRGQLDKRTAQLAESEERRVTARREGDTAQERLHVVTALRDAAVKALARYEADGNLPSFCPCCGGESLCDGCEDGCALRAAREACGAGLSHA